MELGKDSLQQRQIQENATLLVLVFAEVESLRGRLKGKEEELEEVRRRMLRF